MPKNFDTEIREVFNKKYLKVFIKDLSKLSEIKIILNSLDSVKNVNITESSSSNSPNRNLTVYPKRVYSIDEVKNEVEKALNSYFSGRPDDPIFIEDNISSISEVAYRQIIKFIILLGKNLEQSSRLRQNFDEETTRDYFLPYLNSVSKKHSVTGETFNKNGKTDLIIKNENGENVFIAEFKVWRGQQHFIDTIKQLLDRYVNWRDEKLAIVIINKENKNFSNIINVAVDTMKNHPNFKAYNGKSDESSFSFTFKHPEDENKTVYIELILFNLKE